MFYANISPELFLSIAYSVETCVEIPYVYRDIIDANRIQVHPSHVHKVLQHLTGMSPHWRVLVNGVLMMVSQWVSPGVYAMGSVADGMLAMSLVLLVRRTRKNVKRYTPRIFVARTHSDGFQGLNIE